RQVPWFCLTSIRRRAPTLMLPRTLKSILGTKTARLQTQVTSSLPLPPINLNFQVVPVADLVRGTVLTKWWSKDLINAHHYLQSPFTLFGERIIRPRYHLLSPPLLNSNLSESRRQPFCSNGMMFQKMK